MSDQILKTGCRVRRPNKNKEGTVITAGKNFALVSWDSGHKSSVNICKLVLVKE